MKLHLIIILFLAYDSLCFGQTTTVSPTPTQSTSTENTRTKNFGSSLEKYKNKKKQNSQQKSKIEELDDEEVIRIKTDLVVNDVLVTDKNGKMITDLKKDDFIVTENDVPQTVEVFSLGENTTVPRSIVLIIDYYAAQTPYLKNSIEAAKILVNKLNSNDKMAIVTVDVKLRMDFTRDKNLLKKTLDSLENITPDWKKNVSGKAREFLDSLKKNVNPGTGAEFDSLLAVLNEMFDEENRQRIIIFQGDGSEIIWLKPDNEFSYPISDSTIKTLQMKYWNKAGRNFGFSEVKEAIESARVTIYSVATGIQFLGFSKKEQKLRAGIAYKNVHRAWGLEEKYLPTMTREFQGRVAELLLAGQTAMSRVAELSGGSTGFIEKPEDAEKVYANIFENIKNRYVIGYYPTNQEQDGKRREVKIEVRKHPEYVVTGRKAYFASTEEK